MSTFAATSLENRSLTAQKLVRTLFLGLVMFLLLPVLGILSVLVVEGWPALSWSFFFDKPSELGAKGGIWPALVGTVWLTGVALAVALPLGVAAAVYLSEYAKDNWLTRLINLAIVNLAGVPSIVHALFGVGAFVYFLHFGESVLAAGCTLAVMTLPVVIVSTRESLQAVPLSFREACWNMGATRWQDLRNFVSQILPLDQDTLHGTPIFAAKLLPKIHTLVHQSNLPGLKVQVTRDPADFLTKIL